MKKVYNRLSIVNQIKTLSNLMLFSNNSEIIKKKYLLFLFAVWFLIAMHIPLPNSGGYGIDLPLNLFGWFFVFFICFFIWLIIVRDALYLNITLLMLIISTSILISPILWVKTYDQFIFSIPRLLALCGGVWLYFSLIQVRFNNDDLLFIFKLISASAVIESAIVFIGIFFPDLMPVSQQELLLKYGRYAAGTFQQANVSASFLATGLSSTFFLMAYKPQKKNTFIPHKLKYCFLFLCVVSIVSAIVCLKSRTGWVSLFLVFSLTIFIFSLKKYRNQSTKLRMVMLFVSLLFGLALGFHFMNETPLQVLRMHEGSNYQRWLTLVNTLHMISEHPVKGWGLGTYESFFQNWMSLHYTTNPSREIMNHPHNELLYVWFEGGLLALLGCLGLYFCYAIFFFNANHIVQIGLLLLCLPIILHTNLEFPFYYSVTHYIIIIVALAIVDVRRVGELTIQPVSFKSIKLIKRFCLVISLLSCFVLTKTIFDFFSLMKKEQDMYSNYSVDYKDFKVSFLLQSRLEHDILLNKLNEFKNSKNVVFLYEFLNENQKWLLLHADNDQYYNQFMVLHYLGDTENSNNWREKAFKVFPWDKRFDR